MKKKLLVITCTILLSAYNLGCHADSNPDLAQAIKLYKNQNYSQCYVLIDKVIENDPTNALAYYYKAITATQIGKRDEAISNYEKVLKLIPYDNNLSRYAKKGKRCLETPSKCQDTIFDSIEDEFIRNVKGQQFSNTVQEEQERLKIEHLKREINRQKEISPETFKDFRDFSSVPTNDEIVAALRTLQNAGLGGITAGNIPYFNETSPQNQMFNMMNNSSINPQIIQALFTNNISQGF